MGKVARVGTGVMILHDNKVLLGLRTYTPEKVKRGVQGNNSWTFPGGAVEYGESPFQCAVRETEEETGLIIKDLEVVSVSNDYFPPTHFVTVGFFTEKYEGKLGNPEPRKFKEWKWFDLENLPSPLFKPTKRMIENYKKKQIYTER